MDDGGDALQRGLPHAGTVDFTNFHGHIFCGKALVPADCASHFKSAM